MKKLLIYLFCILTLISFAYSDCTLSDDAILYSSFDVNCTIDDSGSGNDGTSNGATWVNTGLLGDGSCYFDGGDYITFDSALNDLAEENGYFTMCGIFNITTYTTIQTPFTMSEAKADGIYDYAGVFFMGTTDDHLDATTNDYDGGSHYNNVAGGSAINDNSVYHFCFTVDSSKHISSYYLNGADKGSDNTSSTGFTFTKVVVGARYKDSSPVTFDYNIIGNVDEVGLWDRVLTSSEILNLYNSGSFCNPYITGNVSTATLTLNNINLSTGNYNSSFLFSFNGSVSYTDEDNFNCSLYLNESVNSTLSLINISQEQVFNLSYGNPAQGFNVNVTCLNNNASDSFKINNVYIDSVIPQVVINADFVNNSLLYMPDMKFNVTINYSDDNLAYASLNLTINNTVIYDNLTLYPNITFMQIEYFNETLLKGNYTLIAIAMDDHNIKHEPHEKADKIEKNKENLKFYFNDNYINFYSPDIDMFEVIDEDNKYKIIIDSDNKKKAWIKLYSNLPLEYIGKTNGHFISLQLEKYIDFVSNDLIITDIIKEDDYNYYIELEFLKDTVKTESLGDLNKNVKIWYFEVLNNVVPYYNITQDLNNETGENFDLVFKFIAYDYNNDIMNLSYAWFLNDSVIETGSQNDIVNNTNITITLDKDNYNIYDILNLTVNLTDSNLTAYIYSNTTIIIDAVELDREVLDCKGFIDFNHYQFTTLDNNPQQVKIWAYYNQTSLNNLSYIMEIDSGVLYFDYIDSEDYYLLEFNFLEEGVYPFVIREYIVDNSTDNCGQRFEGEYRVYNYSFEACFLLYTNENATDEWRETGYILIQPTTDREMNYTILDYLTFYPYTSMNNGDFSYLDFLDKFAYNYEPNNPENKILSGGNWFIGEFKQGRACLDLYFSDYYKTRFVQGDLSQRYNYGQIYYTWKKIDFNLDTATMITPESNELSYYVTSWDRHFSRNLTFWLIELVIFIFAIAMFTLFSMVSLELGIKIGVSIFIGGTIIQLTVMGVLSGLDYLTYLF